MISLIFMQKFYCCHAIVQVDLIEHTNKRECKRCFGLLKMGLVGAINQSQQQD